MECATVLKENNDSRNKRNKIVSVEHLVLGGGSFGGWMAAAHAAEVNAAKNFIEGTAGTMEETDTDENDVYVNKSEEVIVSAIHRMQAFVRGCGSRKRLRKITEDMLALASNEKLARIQAENIKPDVPGDTDALESLAWLTMDEKMQAQRKAARVHAKSEILRESVLSKWIAVKNLLWMSAVGKFVKERMRVKDIVKTQGIVITAAFSEDEDGEEADGDSQNAETETPYERQGDLEMFSLENMAQRRALSKEPQLIAAIEKLWEIDDLKAARQHVDEVSGCKQKEEFMGEETYVDLLIRLQHIIYLHPIDTAATKRNAISDWQIDSVECVSESPGQPVGRMITKDLFVKAMFQLADTWTETVELKDYIDTVERLTRGIVDSSASERGVLVEQSKLRNNSWFAQSANSKYLRFQKFMKARRKRANTERISQGLLLSQMRKIYSSKKTADLHCIERNVRYGEFDRFLYHFYLQQYGDKKIAKHSLRKMVNAVLFYSKFNPRVRLFAKLAGIEAEPLLDVVNRFQIDYNPMMASLYFIPLLDSLVDQSVYGKLPSKQVTTYCTLNNLLVAVHRVCRMLPRDSPAYVTFVQQLARLAIPVSDKGDAEKTLVLGNSTPQQISRRANLTTELKNDLKKTIDMKAFEHKCLLPLDESMLLVHELCSADYDWQLVYRTHVCCKSVLQWHLMLKTDCTESGPSEKKKKPTEEDVKEKGAETTKQEVPDHELSAHIYVMAAFTPKKLLNRNLQERLKFVRTKNTSFVLTIKRVCDSLAQIGVLAAGVAQYLLVSSNNRPLVLSSTKSGDEGAVALNSARKRLSDAKLIDQSINGGNNC